MITRYTNRELSFLAFNDRVLSEAENPDNPPFERAKFAAIVASNLDEFFMVRVGKIDRKIDQGLERVDMAGMSLAQQLKAIDKTVRAQMARLYKVRREGLVPLLSQNGLVPQQIEDMTQDQRRWLSGFFDAQVMPVLTPRSINPQHPFPILAAKRLYLAALLSSDKGGQPQLSLVPVPSSLPRAVLLPMGRGIARYVMLEDVIAHFISRLFPNAEPLGVMPFRLTRNTDFLITLDKADSLIDEMKKNLRKRSFGKIVRIEVPRRYNKPILARLKDALQAEQRIVYPVDGPVDLTYYMKQIYKLPGFDRLRYRPFTQAIQPRLRAKESIFRTIRGGDIFLHHPYDSFDPVVRLLREAADDPNVLAIKMTLYRVSRGSPFIAALARAATLGKQVTVLVEVRARFDEENNIAWCAALEKAGCHVLYGVPRYKTHSKIALVVRREADGLRRYMHIGTGNYNNVTAALYEDMGILTCDRDLGQDANAFFNILTGWASTFPMRELIMSPTTLMTKLLEHIDREIANHQAGLPSGMTLKMNSLSDPDMMQALAKAAKAGVRIDLIVRGVCCLLPVDGENLRVHTIVGRFLEHARAFQFDNAGDPVVYIGSADLMPRNLKKRVELVTPIKDSAIKKHVIDLLNLQMQDNRKRWLAAPDGHYHRADPSGLPLDSQDSLIPHAD